MYEHMTRFSLAPMYDGFSVFVGRYLRMRARVRVSALYLQGCVCVLPRECYGGTVVFRGVYGV